MSVKDRVNPKRLAFAGAIALFGAAFAADTDPRRDAVVEAVERVMPCVVNIATEEIVEYRDPFADLFREFWGPYYRSRPRERRYSLGSGVIIDEEGYVLTNLHVVQRATKVWVQLADGREFEAKAIVGTSRRDVALLKLEPPSREKFKAVKFANDDDLLLGETVLALGNPFGLGGSVSRGILSSKNRRPAREREPLEIADWLQTDAAINPGSSGGPLINLKGELIGLNVAMNPEGQGIGFAIPIKQVGEALSGIFTPESRAELWFGAHFKVGSNPLSVVSVQAGSPAERAGLRVDDQIASVNGQSPRNYLAAIALLCDHSRKSEASMTVVRQGERRNLTVRMKPLTELVREKLGISVQELTADVAQQFGLRGTEGLLVADVETDGPGAQARLRPGMVVQGIAGSGTPTLLGAAAALGDRKKGDQVDLTLLVPQQRGFRSGFAQVEVAVKVR